MALVLADRVQETTTTTGTGTVTLSGAVSGFQSFSAVGNGNTTYYTIADQTGTNWEVGLGTYTASGTTLSRDSVLSSSNSGSLVNFGAGTKNVFVTYPASKAVYNGGALGTPLSGTVTNLTGTASININGTVGATTANTGAFTTLSATGNVTLGDATTDTITLTGTVQPGVVISGSSSGDALRITQTGAGNALLVEDSANPDSSPFVVDTSGNVGIGTSSPAVKLDVVGFTNITNASTALSGTAKGTLRLYDSTAMASGVGAGLAFLGQATTGSGAYTTAGSIQAYKVNGTSGNDAFGLQFTTRSNGSGCATVMSLDDSGNLGIGNTSPSSILTLGNSSKASTTTISIKTSTGDNSFGTHYGTYGALGDGDAYILAGTSGTSIAFMANSATGTIKFAAGGTTERARIDSSGNLGIGTSSWPSGQRLRVAGGDVGFEGQYFYLVNANASIQLGAGQNGKIENTDSTNTLAISRTGASSIITLSTAGTERARITSGGDVVAGATSNRTGAKLSSAGGIGTANFASNRFATVEYGSGASGSFTTITIVFGVDNGSSSVIIETLMTGYSEVYLDNVIGKYGSLPNVTLRNSASSGTSAALTLSSTTYTLTITTNVTHPVVKVKVTAGGLAGTVSLPTFTFA